MRCKKRLFLLIVFFSFLPFSEVKAALNNNFYGNKEISDVQNNINYDITNFSVDENGNNVHFEGWSYIDHMDNYGGANLKTWIVAYSGTWQDKWIDKILNGTYEQASGNTRFYAAPVTYQGNLDLYAARASNDASSSEVTRNIVTANGYTQYSIQKPNDNCGSRSGCAIRRAGIYTIDWCIQRSNDQVGQYISSRCLYYNVGFVVDMSIPKIIETLGDASTHVRFRIVSSATYQVNNDCTKTNSKDKDCTNSSKWVSREKYDSSDLGVSSQSCISVLGEACSDKREFKKNVPVGNQIQSLSIVIGELSNLFQVTSINQGVYSNPGMTGGKSDRTLYSLSENSSSNKYYIKSISPVSSIKGHQGNYNARKFEICYKTSGCNSKRLCPTSSCSGSLTGWVPVTYGVVAGELILNLSYSPAVPTCTDYCIGGNCSDRVIDGDKCYTGSTPIKNSSIVDNQSNSVCSNYTYSTDDSKVNKQTLSSTYYYRLSSSEVAEKLLKREYGDTGVVVNGSSEVQYESSSGYYYFPISFYSNVSVRQTSTFTMHEFEQGATIKSGGHFAYWFDVSTTANWNYVNYFDSLGNGTFTSGDNSYQMSITIPIARNTGTEWVGVVVRLKVGDKLYVKNGNSYSEISYDGVSFYQNLANNNVSNLISGYQNLNGVVKFSDSNDANSKELNTSAGTFNCSYVNHWNNLNAKSISASCSYEINQAYVKIDGSDSQYGYVYYKKENMGDKYMKMPDEGSLYYIPLNLKSGKSFKFYPYSDNFSLVKGISYQYEATCSVVAKNEIVPGGTDSKVKYRPISTENPFPNATTVDDLPKNWKEYVSSHGGNLHNGLNRIKNLSFQTLFYQTKKTTNDLNGLDNRYGAYPDGKDINVDGQSSVLNDNSIFEIVHRSNRFHCKSGEFRDDCDQVS